VSGVELHENNSFGGFSPSARSEHPVSRAFIKETDETFESLPDLAAPEPLLVWMVLI
jgi:hypothetical protein